MNFSSPMLATCPLNLTLLNLVNALILGEKHQLSYDGNISKENCLRD